MATKPETRKKYEHAEKLGKLIGNDGTKKLMEDVTGAERRAKDLLGRLARNAESMKSAEAKDTVARKTEDNLPVPENTAPESVTVEWNTPVAETVSATENREEAKEAPFVKEEPLEATVPAATEDKPAEKAEPKTEAPAAREEPKVETPADREEPKAEMPATVKAEEAERPTEPVLEKQETKAETETVSAEEENAAKETASEERESDMQKNQQKNTEKEKQKPVTEQTPAAKEEKLPSFIKRRPTEEEKQSDKLPSFIKHRPTEEEKNAPRNAGAQRDVKADGAQQRMPKAPRLGPDGKPLPPREARAPRLGPDGKPLPPRAPRLGPDGKPLPPRDPRAARTGVPGERPFAPQAPRTPESMMKSADASVLPMKDAKKNNFAENKKKAPTYDKSEKKPISKRALIKQQGLSVEDFDEDKSGYRKMRGVKKEKKQESQRIRIEKVVLESREISIKDLSEKLGITAVEITKRLFKENIMKTINETVDFDYAELIAADLGIELEYKPPKTAEDILADVHNTDDDILEDNLEKRAPVVTVMGHVDHGKTSLLDAIRNTNVTSGEAGGITQHIGAYSVTVKSEGEDRQITFLDTPGHEAFTAMRARGAQVTDVVVLVVAADDGVMPQTVEAINHAKAANVPIIVAVNKMDKPGATMDRIKIDLMNYGLVPEEYGGDTMLCPVSAKTGRGIDDLLEAILLSTDILDLSANPNREAQGTIIEAKLDKGKGPMASVLIRNGTLHTGDSVISGTTMGKIRAMTDDKGRLVKSAGPSMAVSILGLEEVPNAGDTFFAVEPSLMKKVAEERKTREREAMIQEQSHVTLDDLFGKISEGEVKTLNLIVKGDVQGSVEAVKQSVVKLSNEEVKVAVIHSGAGAITESDVMLADSSNAIILGFNVRPDANAKTLAERNKVDVRSYRIIYELLDDIEAALKGMLTPKYQEVYMGKCEVRQTFRITGVGMVAGCYVLDGKILRGCKLRIYREDVMIVEGNVQQLKRFKDDVKEVNAGFECGCAIEGFDGIMIGDIIECYSIEQIQR